MEEKQLRIMFGRSILAMDPNCDLETQVLLSGNLGYVEAGKLAELINKIAEVERMLKALIKSLEKNTWPLESLNPRILICLRQACMPCRQDFLQLIWGEEPKITTNR